MDYALELGKELDIVVDCSDEPLGKKLANWRDKGVHDIYVVGEKEANLFKSEGIYYAVLNQGKNRSVVVL